MKALVALLIMAALGLSARALYPFVQVGWVSLVNPHYELRPIGDEWHARFFYRSFENDINRMTLVCEGEDARPLHMLDHHGLEVPALEIARARYHPRGCKVYDKLCSRPNAGGSALCAG